MFNPRLSGIAAIALAVVSLGARADGGTITFNGQLQDNTCALTPASQNMTVTLPTLPIIQLPQGQDVGAVPFAIGYTSCPLTFSAAQVYFEFDSENVNPAGYLNNTYSGASTKATGVVLRLHNGAAGSNNSLIDPAQLPGSQNVLPAAINNGAGTAQFSVTYYRPGAATPTLGQVKSVITYTVSYS